MQQLVQNQQETIKKSFKDWGCLQQTWQHEIPLHDHAFHVVAIVAQLSIDNGEKFFQCDHKDLA